MFRLVLLLPKSKPNVALQSYAALGIFQCRLQTTSFSHVNVDATVVWGAYMLITFNRAHIYQPSLVVVCFGGCDINVTDCGPLMFFFHWWPEWKILVVQSSTIPSLELFTIPSLISQRSNVSFILIYTTCNIYSQLQMIIIKISG